MRNEVEKEAIRVACEIVEEELLAARQASIDAVNKERRLCEAYVALGGKLEELPTKRSNPRPPSEPAFRASLVTAHLDEGKRQNR
jgi:hypothetical protein